MSERHKNNGRKEEKMKERMSYTEKHSARELNYRSTE
jgi:hypothetical protein